MRFCRIDGSVNSAEERQAQVRRFQLAGTDEGEEDEPIPVFLLTSQVRQRLSFPVEQGQPEGTLSPPAHSRTLGG